MTTITKSYIKTGHDMKRKTFQNVSLIMLNNLYHDHGSQDTWKSWKTWHSPGIWKFNPENLEYLEFAWKKLKKHLEFDILKMNFYFAKILTKLFDFRELQSIQQRLPSWRGSVKSTWNSTVYIKFYTWKLCISPGKPGILFWKVSTTLMINIA